MVSGVGARIAAVLVCSLLLAGAAFADPIDVAAGSVGDAALHRRAAGPAEAAGVSWPVVGGLLLLVASLGMLVWSFERFCRRVLRRGERRHREVERARRMLYPDLPVNEARRMVWAWEEMTTEERSQLPLARRVEMRQLVADLQQHERRWGRGA